jgi:hypothetical protein
LHAVVCCLRIIPPNILATFSCPDSNRRKAEIQPEALPNFALDTGAIGSLKIRREGLAAADWIGVGALLALFWR